MKKKSLLVATLILSLIPSQALAINVNIDGKPLVMDTKPTVVNGRTLVPMRAIFETLGADVTWNNSSKSILAQKGGTIIKLSLDRKMAYIGNVPYMLDAPAVAINGRTMVPARFVAESLDCTVDWDNKSQTVSISTAKDTPFYGNGIDGAIKELNAIYQNDPDIAYKNIRPSAKSKAISFAISYDSSVSRSDYSELLTKAVENVFAVSKKYNADIFFIEVGLNNSKDDTDIYWHSYNLTKDKEKSFIGDFFYRSKGITEKDISYKNIGKLLNAGSKIPDKKESHGITMEAYKKITNGMSLKKVQEIIGSAGAEQASMENAATYIWSSTGSSGSYKAISVSFVDGKVFTKAQVGL